jgi:hypothetical protein
LAGVTIPPWIDRHDGLLQASPFGMIRDLDLME